MMDSAKAATKSGTANLLTDKVHYSRQQGRQQVVSEMYPQITFSQKSNIIHTGLVFIKFEEQTA